MGRHYKNEIFNRTKIQQICYGYGYGFPSFAKIFGDKYGKKLMDTATNTGIDAAKTASKRPQREYFTKMQKQLVI